MISFNKSVTLNGKIKDVCVSNGKLIDTVTGETIDLMSIFESIYGDSEFEITTKVKTDYPMEIE